MALGVWLMSGKRVVIIGAGIGGLSAGCYARMNGYDVEIHEAAVGPGGTCTSWPRGDYTVDGSIWWLTDSKTRKGYHPIWEELGALQGTRYFSHDVYLTVVGADGRAVHFYADPDRLERHLCELAPGDAAAAREMCSLVRTFSAFATPVGKPGELMGVFDKMRMMKEMAPFLGAFTRAGKVTNGQFALRFKDPLLRGAVAQFLGDEAAPVMGPIFTLALQLNAGRPLGGAREFARTIEKRFLNLGGRVVYGSRIDSVLERGHRVAGVRTAEGDELPADYVISSCDMRWSLLNLLRGEHMGRVHQDLLDTGKVFDPLVMVCFGVDMDFSGEISCMGAAHQLDQPVELAGRLRTHLPVANQCHDPSLAPAGKSVVISMFETPWTHWEPLANNEVAYEAEKGRIASFCTEQIALRYPGFGDRVEMIDVVTPLTWARYTGNWRGAYMSWDTSADMSTASRYTPKGVPGLDGFYMASMWTNAPGGVCGAALGARETVQLLCHADKKPFEVTRP